MNQNLAATTETTTKTTKCCPMCRLPVRVLGGLIAERDDAGQNFTFVICARCGSKYRQWPPKIRRQQLRAAVGLIAAHPEHYDVKLFDSKEAAVLYINLEADDVNRRYRGSLRVKNENQLFT